VTAGVDASGVEAEVVGAGVEPIEVDGGEDGDFVELELHAPSKSATAAEAQRPTTFRLRT
jgi:hypothetical protein